MEIAIGDVTMKDKRIDGQGGIKLQGGAQDGRPPTALDGDEWQGRGKK